MNTSEMSTFDHLPEDRGPIDETVTLPAMNKIVRHLVVDVRRDRVPMANVLKLLRFAAHLGADDAKGMTSDEPLHWTKHLELVKFVRGFTREMLKDGMQLDVILGQLRLAAWMGERDYLKATYRGDKHATKELPKIDPGQYVSREAAGWPEEEEI
ncbi:hypothetical protein G4Y79_20775 [Phototrophicus methaneseepsis]|uniref:Uncharacterized protein n=1 Tax=Phototrophicus methaneseepsis TaxID=2710758 RepID=A0A7S8E832_9CHLR|nr:hypothetical protein [Phototrophicus methaneseepsis]QPC82091.1 hypothetical protein G4Y79_20775 [Phototrophicus methaneseepsis]